MTDVLLEARGVEVIYGTPRQMRGLEPGGMKVLHGIDLTIERGRSIGIVGESGSGKSTFGRALLRLIDVSTGAIAFEGRDITHLDRAAMRPLRRRMQMIFQDPMASLNPRHTIRQILMDPMLFHRVVPDAKAGEARIRALIERVGLPAVALGRHPHELSGGQRQRVGIARAALLSPDFLLCDEIVSGLDVSTQAQVLNLLKDLCRDLGLAMAFISHDLAVIRAVCDRVMVLRAGRVEEQGPCESVFTAPQSPYTRRLLDAIPLPVVDPGWLAREGSDDAAD